MLWILVILVGIAAAIGIKKVVSDHIKKVYVDWRLGANWWASVWKIPASLVLGVIYKESGGVETAKGKTGDYGLMQITQPALTDFNKARGKNYSLLDMLDADKCIEVGSWYLSWLKKNFNLSWTDTLRAYNVGIGTIGKSETAGIDYARGVLAYQQSFQELMI